MVEFLKQWEKENEDWERLPAVVPFVFYHGAETWKIPNAFLHLVDSEEAWEPYLLNFRFPVLDVGKIPDGELSGDRRLHVRLLAMKYATRYSQQASVRDLLTEALKYAPEELRSVLFYLIQTYSYDKEDLRGIIHEVKPEEEDKMMSQFAQEIESRVRQQALMEGRREGFQEGEAIGEAGLLLHMPPRRFGPLPNEIAVRVYGADRNTIKVWADRVFDAKSLDEVFTE